MNKIKIPAIIQSCLSFISQMQQIIEYDYLKEVVEFHKKFIQPYKGFPRGCRDSEIENLENHFGFEFPTAYKEYLKL